MLQKGWVYHLRVARADPFRGSVAVGTRASSSRNSQTQHAACQLEVCDAPLNNVHKGQKHSNQSEEGKVNVTGKCLWLVGWGCFAADHWNQVERVRPNLISEGVVLIDFFAW